MVTEPLTPRPRPCASCPYRRDVPSGVWESNEYDKLYAYDADTSEQPPAIFMCHQPNEGGATVCAGWLGHTDPADLLAVRLGVAMGALDPAALDYTTDVDLFDSGAEAAAHGLADIDRPSDAARRVVAKIQRRRQR